ncbi:MAG: hypothetical protein ACK5S6_04615 [bacterium]
MDYITDEALISDLERFASRMTAATRQRFYDLIAQAVEQGMEAERRMSDTSDCRYYVG